MLYISAKIQYYYIKKTYIEILIVLCTNIARRRLCQLAN